MDMFIWGLVAGIAASLVYLVWFWYYKRADEPLSEEEIEGEKEERVAIVHTVMDLIFAAFADETTRKDLNTRTSLQDITTLSFSSEVGDYMLVVDWAKGKMKMIAAIASDKPLVITHKMRFNRSGVIDLRPVYKFIDKVKASLNKLIKTEANDEEQLRIILRSALQEMMSRKKEGKEPRKSLDIILENMDTDMSWLEYELLVNELMLNEATLASFAKDMMKEEK